MAAAQLPFTSEQFFDVFERYNTDLPFAGAVMAAIAVAVVLLALITRGFATRAACVLLGGLWAWTGVVYHLLYFSEINPAAFLFGAMFIVQAGLMLAAALRTEPPKFRIGLDPASGFGVVLILYALIVYPLIGAFVAGHQFPRTPTFGLPCPLTIFTFAFLAFYRGQLRLALLVIPVLWALIGTSAAVLFGIWQDLGLLVAAIGSLVWVIVTASRSRLYESEQVG